MKKNRLMAIILLTALTITCLTPSVINADNDVPAQKVTKIVASTNTITVGQEFDLKAYLSPTYADDDNLVWKIVGKKGIIRFDDDDRDDDEAEFKALKAGKTKVRCSILGKGKKYSKTITITVKKAKKATGKITRVGAKNVVVEYDDDFELKVKKSASVSEGNLKWTIKNTNILRFDDGDRYGKEVDLEAIKVGTTTVTCKNTKTKQTITYTVKVVPDTDDDWDD